MKHHQIQFEEIRVSLFTDTTDEKLSQYNSDFKVPILKHGDIVLWDSLSILEYLSEQILDTKGWPDDIHARAIARSISCEIHSSYANVRNELPMNCRKQFHNIEPSVDAKREIRRITSLWRECRSQYGNDGEWLFGQYSIADAMFAPIALRFHGYNIPLDAIEQTYVQSVLNQPGIIEWMTAGKAEQEIIVEDEITT